jgi:cytochrome c oxidase assembly factor CtaG
MRALRLGAALAALTPSAAMAHVLEAPGTERPGWTTDPWITLPLATLALLYAFGWRRLHARSERGVALHRRRAMFFAVGWLTLTAALVSPLHEAGERSFTAHMIEHELLMLLAAPLIILARPGAALLWALPDRARRDFGRVGARPWLKESWRWLTGAVTATILQAAVLWIWHLPSLFDRALASDGWHIAQHLSFVLSSLLFWSAMLGAHGGGSRSAGERGVAILCLFLTSLVSGALGALMAFSQSPWYAGYASLGMAPFGLTPTEDQQLAGAIMWVPGGLVHAAAALALAGTMLRQGGGARHAG